MEKVLTPAEQFADDMEEAGLEVEAYHGRFFWYGPAVRVDNLQDAMSVTKVQVQWDNLGLGYIVYPLESSIDWYEKHGGKA